MGIYVSQVLKVMTAPPFASPISFSDSLSYQGKEEGYWYLFQEGKELLLLRSEEQDIPCNHSFPLKRSVYLGKLNDKHLFAGEVDHRESMPSGWEWKNLRTLFGILSDEHFSIAGRAMQLLHWDRVHLYCGCCGDPTFPREKERCRECSSCGHLAFPKIAPVIMALVTKGNQVLLARSPHFPEKMYSVLAGYVDPGETLEQCVEREVFEEVGIRVKNIRYFNSQPWPFSHSLIIGFICEWKSGTINIDPNEITDAAWFDSSNLPQLPYPLSLSRIMIDKHFLSLL